MKALTTTTKQQSSLRPKPVAGRLTIKHKSCPVNVSKQLDSKQLNVSASGRFYEKAASRRSRHRAALLKSKSADEAVPLAGLGRRAAEPWRPRRKSVMVALEFEHDPNLQAVKGKPVSFQGKNQRFGKVQHGSIIDRISNGSEQGSSGRLNRAGTKRTFRDTSTGTRGK